MVYIYYNIYFCVKSDVKLSLTWINATEVKRSPDMTAMLLEDVVVNWLHADPNRIPAIRQCQDHRIFLLDKNGPQSSDAVSWL